MTTPTAVRVDLGDRSYDIEIGERLAAQGRLGRIVGGRFPNHRHVLITDRNVEPALAGPILGALREAAADVELFVLPPGEEAKNLHTVSTIYDFLIERKYGRQTVILALGGGVVGDTVGFAAATFLRGVPFIQIPTTLLAMVDSSVGGKTGVNHPKGKNLIGAFKQPDYVMIDPLHLASLPDEEFRSGLAEVVKYGMIADEPLFGFLERGAGAILGREGKPLAEIIERSCRIKAEVVMEDETETGRRAILNFGHTFAHAVEALANYQGVRHGEAVAMGMVAACRLGERSGGFAPESTERLIRLLQALGLPTVMPRFEIERYIDVMRSDKKARGNTIRFVLPTRIGEVEIRDDVEVATVREVLAACVGG